MHASSRQSRLRTIARQIARLLAAPAVATVVAGCTDAVAPPVAPPGPEATHYLLFTSSPRGADAADIYRVNVDGTERRNISGSPAFYGGVSVAPDGRRMAFYSTRGGCPGIWTMTVDGADLRQHTTRADGCSYRPRWSPDGDHIVFDSDSDGISAVYVMSPDGSGKRELSARPGAAARWAVHGGWTPDGRVVLQYRSDDLLPETFVVRPDGSGLQPLLPQVGDHSPKWSPDGSRVAFIRESGSGSSLYVMNADGSNARQLTAATGAASLMGQYSAEHDFDYWSPDGRRIAFYRWTPGSGWAVTVIGADGAGETRVSDYQETGPDGRFTGWSPDGRLTLHRVASSGLVEVILRDPAGTGQERLIGSQQNDSGALWVPLR